MSHLKPYETRFRARLSVMTNKSSPNTANKPIVPATLPFKVALTLSMMGLWSTPIVASIPSITASPTLPSFFEKNDFAIIKLMFPKIRY
jgi:hypothetical protein